MMFYEMDLAGFFADFGEPAIVKGNEISVIFDDTYATVTPMDLEIGTSLPRATAKTADVETLVQGDILEIRNVSYRIKGPPESDGTGMTVLNLTRD
jgi:hypothetical protein